MKSGLCWTDKATSDSFITTTDCTEASLYAILPSGPLYTIRRNLPEITQSDPSRLRTCGTIGRGRVLGLRFLKLDNCTLGEARKLSWESVGAMDQKFLFNPDAFDRQYSIEEAFGAHDCLSVEGGSNAKGAALIGWKCNRQADQLFELNYVGPPDNFETTLMETNGWIMGRHGYRAISVAFGVDIPGGNFTQFQTIADDGQYCRKVCANSGAQCKGFTWTAAGVDDPKPMCYLKSALGQPKYRGTEATVISGLLGE